jgi:hypothetical protein
LTKEDNLGYGVSKVSVLHLLVQNRTIFSISHLTRGDLPVIFKQLHNVSPPKGTTNSDYMRDYIIVICILYQLDPGQIMKMFEQKTLVLNFEIYNSNTSL